MLYILFTNEENHKRISLMTHFCSHWNQVEKNVLDRRTYTAQVQVESRIQCNRLWCNSAKKHNDRTGPKIMKTKKRCVPVNGRIFLQNMLLLSFERASCCIKHSFPHQRLYSYCKILFVGFILFFFFDCVCCTTNSALFTTDWYVCVWIIGSMATISSIHW